MLFSSFSTRSMVFAYFAKAQLPFFLFRDLFNDTAEFTLCYGLHDCSHLFQGYFIHSLSTLYYYNAPSLATRLTGDYRDRTYTGKCSPTLLDTRKIKEGTAESSYSMTLQYLLFAHNVFLPEEPDLFITEQKMPDTIRTATATPQNTAVYNIIIIPFAGLESASDIPPIGMITPA